MPVSNSRASLKNSGRITSLCYLRFIRAERDGTFGNAEVILPQFLSAMCLVLAILSNHAHAQNSSATVDFSRDVIPILTKAGCNTGACHGAAAGRGYLTLSLFGSRPADDYESIVHAHTGRYIDVQEPLSSLLLQKPGGFLEHGGNVRLDSDGADFQLLKQWIAQQVPVGTQAKLQKITIQPSEMLELKVGESARISVSAVWSDGRATDPTPWVVVDGASSISGDETAPLIYGLASREEIQLTAQKTGYWPVTLRVGSLARSIQVWVREAKQDEAGASAKLAHQRTIDDCIARSGQRVGLQLSGPAEPYLLARRLWIDLTGQHPNRQQWQESTHSIRDGNLVEVVDELLASESFDRRAGKVIAGWVAAAGKGTAAQENQLAANIALFLDSDSNLQHLVHTMLSVDEKHTECASGFHQFANDPRSRAELVASVFMGVRIGCAQCHDHPLDHWTQDDYFSLAACWAEIESQAALRRSPGRVTTDLRTGEAATPRLPGESSVYQGKLPPDAALTDWICKAENDLLTANLTNRIWVWLMGQGLVMEVDDHRATNPPINVELLQLLSQHLVEQDFSLKAIVRSIVLSEAYQRKSDNNAPPLAYRLGSTRSWKDIDLAFAELAAGALDILQSETGRDGPQESMMMVEIDQGCSRYQACSDPVREGLNLIAGQEINRVVKTAIANSWQEGGADVPSLVTMLRKLYFQVFGQEPAPASTQQWNQLLSQANGQQRREIAEDLLWSWLVDVDFLQLH